MDEQKLKGFNVRLSALLLEYDCDLAIEDVPATKKIIVVPKKKPEVTPEVIKVEPIPESEQN